MMHHIMRLVKRSALVRDSSHVCLVGRVSAHAKQRPVVVVAHMRRREGDLQDCNNALITYMCPVVGIAQDCTGKQE